MKQRSALANYKLRITSYKLRVTDIFILFVLMAFSCSQDTSVSTFTVSNGDFSNSLVIEGFVEPVRSTMLTSPRGNSGTIEFLVEDGEYVEEGQVVCIITVQYLKDRYDDMTLALENAETGLIKTQADLNMQFAILEAQVRINDADTRLAQMDSLQIAFMSTNQRRIKELELEKVSIEKAQYEKKLNNLKIIQQSEIRKLELEIQRLKINIQNTKDQLDAYTLRAPRDGMALRSNNPIVSVGSGVIIISSGGSGKKFQVGDQVFSNFPVVSMPEFEQMKVMIMASETDFKNISVNDSINYTFDAMPGNSGTGKILKKTPIGQPYKRGSNVKFFEIEASIDSVLTMPEPGFTANCKVILKQADNVIAVPQIAVFEEDSIKVVFVQRKNGYERRQVLTGISSQRESVITAGLDEGDVIALNKPKSSLVKERIALPDSLINKQETPVDIKKQGTFPDVPGSNIQIPHFSILN